MEAKFWEEAWENGQIGFHQGDFNKNLVEYFELLNLQKNQEVLVPLCGKTLDMNFLLQQHLIVNGVELVEQAIKDYLNENKIDEIKVENVESFKLYSTNALKLYHGDFHLFQQVGKTYNAIYDRASMIALPPMMRRTHAEVLTALTNRSGKILLITLEYEQSKVSGPPHSVTEEEIEHLFQENFDIQLLNLEKTKNIGPKFKDNGVNFVTQKVYLLTKRD